MKTFELIIKTPTSEAVHEAATELHVDTEGGRIVILPGHASLTGSVAFSRVLVREENKEMEFFVKNGVVYTELGTNKVQLLCMSYEETSETSLQSAQDYLDTIKKLLENKESLSAYQIGYLDKEQVALTKQVDLLIKSDDHLGDK